MPLAKHRVCQQSGRPVLGRLVLFVNQNWVKQGVKYNLTLLNYTRLLKIFRCPLQSIRKPPQSLKGQTLWGYNKRAIMIHNP